MQATPLIEYGRILTLSKLIHNFDLGCKILEDRNAFARGGLAGEIIAGATSDDSGGKLTDLASKG
jgi:hypothetical protein